MRARPKALLLLLIGVAASRSAVAVAPAPPTNAELSRQIEALRTQVEELRAAPEGSLSLESDAEPPMRSFLSDELHFGGFFETAVTELHGPDTATQVSAASHTLGINLSATFGDDFRFVSQLLTSLSFPVQNFENDPRATAAGLPRQRRFAGFAIATLPAQGYVEYRASDLLRVQAGLGYVPFGYAFQQRELVLFIRRNGPQLINTLDLVSPLWTGVHALGVVALTRSRAGYDVYTMTPLDEPQTLGGGARAWWSSPADTLTLGMSTQVGKKLGQTFEAFGVDARWVMRRVTVTAEYARRLLARDEDPWSAYVEPSVAVYGESVLLYVFADYVDNPFSATTLGTIRLATPYRRLAWGGGFNWLPTSFTRFRIGYFAFDYLGDDASLAGQNRDLGAIDLSAGIAF